MKLVRVNQSVNRITLTCIKCGKRGQDDGYYADVHGLPYVDYYCGACAEEFRGVHFRFKGE